MKAHNKETQAQMTPRKALHFLQEGNDRFINNLKANRNLLEQVNETRDGQWPFATILSCIDSRTSAELIFDQGLGDVFSVRIAGNIVNGIIDASFEIDKNPYGSQKEELLNDRIQDYRYIVFKSYKIIYWIDETNKMILVSHVFDTRRNPKKLHI